MDRDPASLRTHVQRVRPELLSALTVALVGLPQCLAYAMMSGLPPAYGLVTAAVPGFVAALAGRSPQIVTGPTNTTGLLILAALGPFLGSNGLLTEAGLPLLATLTLLAGAIRLVAAYLGGAAIVDFLPESVLVGFTAGAGVLIGVMQLDEALGLAAVHGGGLIEEIRGVAAALAAGARPEPWAVLVCALTSLVIWSGARWRPRWPLALLAVGVATGVAFWLGLDRALGLPVVGDRAAVPAGWPPGALPTLDPAAVRALMIPAAAIALLGTFELAVCARRGGARPDMRREISAQGWGNVAGAFASAFPASASLTRSELLRQGGARTRWAAALAAILIVPALLWGGPLIEAIPQASLAGVLLVTAAKMIDVPHMLRMARASSATRSLLVVTFGSTLIAPLEWAILLGASLALVIHLVRTSRPRLVLLGVDGEALVPCEHPPGPDDIAVLEVSGDLHYAAVDRFLARARVLLGREARRVVIDLSHAHAMRFGALLACEELAGELSERGGALILAGVTDEFGEVLRRAESTIAFVPYQRAPLASIQRAIARLRAPDAV